ncbi:MAG: glycosyltransferase family 4 protein [bacterium]
MRILMIAPQPFFQPRGTPFSVLHRLRALSTLGHQVDLLTYHLGQEVDIDGVTIHRIRNIPFIKKIAIGPSKRKVILDGFLILKTRRMLEQRQYDLIHSHEEAGFWAAYFARKYGLMHLYDMHSSLPQQLTNFRFSRSSLLNRVFEKLEAYTINSAQAVITICPELHDYVQARFPQKLNTLIENVADNSKAFNSRVNSEEIGRKIKTNGEVAVLYAGTFEPYQGIDLLIDSSVEIISRQPAVRFVLVGGKPEQVEFYKNRTRELQVSDHFVFAGSVAPEEVPAYIANSDVLVSPRLEGNNTPLKIYSYLRSGKPIVATNHITHTQVLTPEVAVLTDTTPAAFSEGVLAVLRDVELGKRLSQNARVLAEKNYSYEAYLSKTKMIFDYLEELGQQGQADKCAESVV